MRKYDSTELVEAYKFLNSALRIVEEDSDEFYYISAARIRIKGVLDRDVESRKVGTKR